MESSEENRFTIKIVTWNIHSFYGCFDANISKLLEDNDVDVCFFQEATKSGMSSRKFGPDPGALVGRTFFAGAPTASMGNGIYISSKKKFKVFREAHKLLRLRERSALSIGVVFEGRYRIQFFCTHLDHVDEDMRMIEAQTLLDFVDTERVVLGCRNQSFPHVIGGDFNALSRADYTDARWTEITRHRAMSSWEPPQSRLVDEFLVRDNFYVDVCAKSDLKVWSSRFDTRIDYFFANADAIREGFEFTCLGSLPNTETMSDHKTVVVEMKFPKQQQQQQQDLNVEMDANPNRKQEPSSSSSEDA